MTTINRVGEYVDSCVLSMEGFTIDRGLLPNNRSVRSLYGDHRLRSVQRAQTATILTPLVNTHGIRFDPAARIGVALKVWWARERDQNYELRYFPFPDGDNLNAACKGLFDGLADALGVNDRRFDVQPPSQLRSGGDPCVAIHLRAIIPTSASTSTPSWDGAPPPTIGQ